MDEDRIEGAARDMGGTIKDALGGMVGDNRAQAEGRLEQIGGQVQHAYGAARDALGEGAETLGEQVEEFVRDQPMVAVLAAAAFGFVCGRLLAR